MEDLSFIVAIGKMSRPAHICCRWLQETKRENFISCKLGLGGLSNGYYDILELKDHKRELGVQTHMLILDLNFQRCWFKKAKTKK